MTPRPMVDDDVDRVVLLARRTFNDLVQRRHEDPWLPPDDAPIDERSQLRHRTILANDPDGCWVVEDDEGLVGAALATRVGWLWFLSLLVVRPGRQGGGIGRALMDVALVSARDAEGAGIAASSDPPALHRYARAGFRLVPTLHAKGVPAAADLVLPEGVRRGGAGDLEHCQAVARRIRGVDHGPYLQLALDSGGVLFLTDGGYAVGREGTTWLVATEDLGDAARLLRASWTTAAEREGGPVAEVSWITSEHPWAVDTALEAGLRLSVSGPLCVRGRLEITPTYLPNGAFW